MIPSALLVFAVLAAPSAPPGPAAALERQAKDWNRGDLAAFCAIYAEDATFVAPSGVTKGRAQILARYRAKYDTAEKRGALSFDVLEVRRSKDVASVALRWRREGRRRGERALAGRDAQHAQGLAHRAGRLDVTGRLAAAGPDRYPEGVRTPPALPRALLAAGALSLLPACAEGIMFGAWALTTLVTGAGLYALRHVFALDWTHDRHRMLSEAAEQLALPPPPSAEAGLDFVSPAGHPVRAHATPHLELRMPLVDWLPPNLVIDTIAPPMRGLRQLVPDPRFLEWVAAGDPAELLGATPPEVRDALLEAHHYGPGPGICIRRGHLEVALPWRDLDLLDVTLERMDRIAVSLAALPESLPERLRASVESTDRVLVRQASLRALQAYFPEHPETRAARAFAEANNLVPRLLSAPQRQARRGALALAPRQDGKLSVSEDDEAA